MIKYVLRLPLINKIGEVIYMRRTGKKYEIGTYWVMKVAFKSLMVNEKVKIVNVDKRGRKTIVDVEDINAQIIKGVSVKKLRKRAR